MNNKQFETEFWSILTKNKLDDLSQFHKSGFRGETPLYTRLTDMSFAAKLKPVKINSMLLSTSLKYLQSIIAYKKHSKPFFAAINIWNFPDDELLVPNIFVWSGNINKLKKILTLNKIHSTFAKKIKTKVLKLFPAKEFDILEYDTTMPEFNRAFIGPTQHYYKCVVPLDYFKVRNANSSND